MTLLVAAAMAALLPATRAAAQTDSEMCLECHGTPEQVLEAAEMFGVDVSAERAQQLAVHGVGPVHEFIGCVDCHPGADEIPHPEGIVGGNPCVMCHDAAMEEVSQSAHQAPEGSDEFRASCWDCHTAHDVRPPEDPESALNPPHVAERCLACHDKQAYLVGVHGYGVQMAGLDIAATCVSCHGGHDILSPSTEGSRVARRNISFTCGTCHGRVAEVYRESVHGAALTADDNPDVPTCVDCHEAHGTTDPRSPGFRVNSPEICGTCHANDALMEKYGLSTEVFETYVADFHGTTAKLFHDVTPDQPLNQAVCFDCHGYHDVQAVHGVGQEEINQRMLVRCEACHEGISASFLSAWTAHYIPSPDRYALIYYVRLFYIVIIPATVGFFLLYIAIDWRARRRHGRHV